MKFETKILWFLDELTLCVIMPMLKIASNRINYKLLSLIPTLMGIVFVLVYTFVSTRQVVFLILGSISLIIGALLLIFLKATCLIDYDQKKNIVIIKKSKKERLTLSLDQILNIRELYFFPIQSQEHKSSHYSQYGIIYKSEGKTLTIPFIIYDNHSELMDNLDILRAKVNLKRREKIQSLKTYT